MVIGVPRVGFWSLFSPGSGFAERRRSAACLGKGAKEYNFASCVLNSCRILCGSLVIVPSEVRRQIGLKEASNNFSWVANWVSGLLLRT